MYEQNTLFLNLRYDQILIFLTDFSALILLLEWMIFNTSIRIGVILYITR